MNFEARYLIRWGVPGWVFIISIGFYFVLIEYTLFDQNRIESISSLLDKSTELLAAAAFLTIVGIPVGYILNQIHHVWIWVIRVNWKKYFRMELKLNEVFYEARNGKELKDRYSYLLTRIHELGSIVVGLEISLAIIFCLSFNYGFNYIVIIYMFVLSVVCFIIWLSRKYYRRNFDALTREIVEEDYKTVMNRTIIWLLKKRKKILKF